MGVYPRRIKSCHETFCSDAQLNRPSLDIKVVIEPYLLGVGIVHRRPNLGHDENERKALHTV